MTRRVTLREIAHARTGDKGNTSNLSVFVYDGDHYDAVAAQLTGGTTPSTIHEVPRRPVMRFD